MSMEADVANQAVSMELELIKLLGSGAVKVLGRLSAGSIALIMSIYRKHKNNQTLKPGEISLKKLTDAARRNGTELVELTIPNNLQKEFSKAVKDRGIQASIIKVKTTDPPYYAGVVNQNDAARVDRIIEEMKINYIDVSKESVDKAKAHSTKGDHMTDESADEFFEAMNSDEVINEPDPFAQSRTTEGRSENGSRNSRSENIGDSDLYKSEGRQSIKDRMNNIKESRAAKAKDNPVREGADKIVDFAEKAKDLKEKVKGREQ